jgi:hypothetical protein
VVAATTLPQPHDFEVAIPPTRFAWARRVTGANLWLYYEIRDERPPGEILLLSVVTSPPVPVD